MPVWWTRSHNETHARADGVTMQKNLFEAPKLLRFTPRDYQQTAHDKAFEFWDTDERGVLVRLFTGGGKTPTACMIAGTWLARGDDYRVMIVSYEQQLVWQFAEEVVDFLGIQPGIEMGSDRAKQSDKVVVASRASLLLAPELLDDQRAMFKEEYGIMDLGPLWKARAESWLKMLKQNRATPEQIRDQIELLKREPEAHGDKWSRLHRFNPDLNWLLIFDEAHRHIRKLRTIGYLTDWFWANKKTKQLGLTATPKRADGVSIGSQMFPSIAADYPLFHYTKPCAVKDGYAVPYQQQYISVEGVDFKSLKKIAGDFDDSDLERILGEESTLAKLCQPMLDLVGDRRTLIFSPGVEMAANVARFVNARSEAVCPECQSAKWYPSLLIGDGAKCDCGTMIESTHITKRGQQAQTIHGGTRPEDRKEIYSGHQGGMFQFLSVCGLCLDSNTLILTDVGEVPISEVTRDMKLWDGIEWVSHDGVIFQGTKPVIEYAGLKATGDHNVWTDFGWKELAVCKQQRLEIRVAGIEGKAIRESDGYYRRVDSSGEATTRRAGSKVPRVWSGEREICRRNKGRSGWLQELCEIIRSSKLASHALSFCKEALREPKRSVLQGLRRAWHSVSFCHSYSDGAMDYGDDWTSSRHDTGPRREQQALRAWQYPVGISGNAGEQSQIAETGIQAVAERNAEVYDILNAGPRNRFVANGLIVSNCREGYNDPDISAVVVFRPVSKEASSLAEQMKGRGCRPARAIIRDLCTLKTSEERRQLIAESTKPDCLIIDLVGITGLGDCASTALIYADGLPDEIVDRMEKILEEEGGDVEEVVERAEREAAEEKERIKQERLEAERRAKEEFEKRAKANADVTYSVHDVGHSSNASSGDPREATDGQYRFVESLGVEIVGYVLTKKQAGRLIEKLLSGETPQEATRVTGIDEQYWKRKGPSAKQLKFASWKRIDISWCQSSSDATLAISARMNPQECREKLSGMIKAAGTDAALTSVGKKMKRCGMERDSQLIVLGSKRRSELHDNFVPEGS